MPQKRPDFFEHTPAQLQKRLAEWGEPAFRTGQVIGAAWTPGAEGFARATALSQALRTRLDAAFSLPRPPAPVQTRRAADGTVKALFAFADGAQVESVAIPAGEPTAAAARARRPDAAPARERMTFCLSTQCGCALGCRFCATAALGFKRNLTPGEIIAQVRGLAALVRRDPTNLVFMGMGEPLQNLESLRAALAILGHPQALHWAARKTTVSTSGWLPGLQAIVRDPLPARLAFSLNAPRDEVRSRLMPVNRRYPLAQVLAGLRDYARATGESVTIEYVLLGGVNDSTEDARLLTRLLRNLPSKLNLIPWNPNAGGDFRPPAPEAVDAFLRELQRGPVLVTFRESRGAEIGAACGQLAGLRQRSVA